MEIIQDPAMADNCPDMVARQDHRIYTGMKLPLKRDRENKHL
jgi:hypothetical protein